MEGDAQDNKKNNRTSTQVGSVQTRHSTRLDPTLSSFKQPAQDKKADNLIFEDNDDSVQQIKKVMTPAEKSKAD